MSSFLNNFFAYTGTALIYIPTFVFFSGSSTDLLKRLFLLSFFGIIFEISLYIRNDLKDYPKLDTFFGIARWISASYVIFVSQSPSYYNPNNPNSLYPDIGVIVALLGLIFLMIAALHTSPEKNKIQ